MSITEYNGSALVAMSGKDCVAIAADRRLGQQFFTISTDFDKIFEMGPHLYMGLPGLATDILTVQQRLQFRTNMFELRENRPISPLTFKNVVSNFLYEHRWAPYFVEPMIAGLEKSGDTWKPFISSFDLIGCPLDAKDFVVGGTAANQLYGMCETLYHEDMNSDELFEAISQSLLNAMDRDCLSGWGAVVYVIEGDKVTRRLLKSRMD